MNQIQTQPSAELKNLGLPKPDQIGFVVRDLDAAIALYEPLFGPLKVTNFGPQKAHYRNNPESDYELKFAFGMIGDMEIELIEWVSGDTPHRDFLQRGQEGMHHLRFRVDDADTWVKKIQTIGYQPVWTARISPEVAYAYCEREGDPLVLEFLEYRVSGDPSDSNL